MGIFRTVLILVFLILPGIATSDVKNLCRKCHGSHHVERGSCVDCHRGNNRTDRKEIAHHNLIAGRFAYFTLKDGPVLKKGKELVDILACRRCHIYETKGCRLATDLSKLAADTTPQDIFNSIKSPVLFMPNFYLSDSQIAALVNAILAVSVSSDFKIKETAQVVHFENEKHRDKNIFAKQCGPCHKILSEKFGGLGEGNIGPNLSGLFSEFYPKTYRHVEPWTIDRLRKWIENPRNVNPTARMRPINFATGELESLVETIQINATVYKQIPPDL